MKQFSIQNIYLCKLVVEILFGDERRWADALMRAVLPARGDTTGDGALLATTDWGIIHKSLYKQKGGDQKVKLAIIKTQMNANLCRDKITSAIIRIRLRF